MKMFLKVLCRRIELFYIFHIKPKTPKYRKEKRRTGMQELRKMGYIYIKEGWYTEKELLCM